MIRLLWESSVLAACVAFGTGRTQAKLFVLGLWTWLGLMVLSTWFVWLTIIAAALAVFLLLLAMEYSLRLYYRINDSIRSKRCHAMTSVSMSGSSNRLRLPCADVQGRIAAPDLDGCDFAAMADGILREASIRKVQDSLPSWLRFPAICSAMPSLVK